MEQRQTHVWTIDASQPFAACLVHGILERFGRAPLALAETVVLLPNQRAVRTVQTAFLQAFEAQASLLPRLAVLGEDLDEGLISESPVFAGGGALDATIEPMARLKILAQLIDRWQADKTPKPASTPAHVARLAASLARLIDQANTEGLSFEALDDLVPEEFAVHWQDILTFLSIVTRGWPEILAEQGQMDASLARRLRLETLAQQWQDSPPTTPIIAAGSTGSIPATAALLKTIQALPQGHVVLPPLDRTSAEETWADYRESHPQGALKRLVSTLDVARSEIGTWHRGPAQPNIEARLNAIAAAMAPASAFHAEIQSADPGALQSGLEVIEASTAHEEATAIALLMREALETPEQTAALITPDRRLARHVRSVLSRWDIQVDDSAGEALAATPPARFVLLLAEALAANMAPAPLLALLKHPYFQYAQPRSHILRIARTLDKTVLRGVRPAGGLKALEAHCKDGEAAAFLKDLGQLFAAWPTTPQPAWRLIKQLFEWAETLASGPDGMPFLGGEDGHALATWADAACQPGPGFDAIAPEMIGPLMEALMAGHVVRKRQPGHPRLAILGTIEARMVRPDVAILGGLNEGVWPPAATADPWMNEPMRVSFGLPPHDRRIGLSALDFYQACGAERVVITRTTKQDGAPTQPSRWISRLQAAFGSSLKTGDAVLSWARALNQPSAYKPWPQPRPTPPVSLRPKDVSVSDVERWLRDPYALYAKHVLKLRPLDMMDQPPSAADKGSTIHDALETFFAKHMAALPHDAESALIKAGETSFAKWRDKPGIYALWWPRFVDTAHWVTKEQARLLGRGRRIAGVEVSGHLELAIKGQSWRVRAKADRIDESPDGLVILDYKTGAVPDKKIVHQGLAPQLALEALIAQKAGFGPIQGPVGALEYWGLSTTTTDGPKRDNRFDAERLIEDAEAGLTALFEIFSDPKTPYLHAPAPEYAPYRDYDDLARPEEWRDVPEARGHG